MAGASSKPTYCAPPSRRRSLHPPDRHGARAAPGRRRFQGGRGRKGFPFVEAGCDRSGRGVGAHRVRMVVASFLARTAIAGRGAPVVPAHLVAGDRRRKTTAGNGCGQGNRPRPFFRIFNPGPGPGDDPDGDYVRRGFVEPGQVAGRRSTSPGVPEACPGTRNAYVATRRAGSELDATPRSSPMVSAV